MTDDSVGREIFDCFSLIAKGHEQEGQPGIPGCPFICPAVAHEQGAGRGPAGCADGFKHMVLMGLAVGSPVGAEDGGETAGQAELADQSFAEILALVRADAECGARIQKGVQCRDAALKRAGAHSDVVYIISDEPLECGVHIRRGQGDAVNTEAALHHRAGAIADQRGNGGQVDRGKARIGEHMVERAEQVWRGIHQGSVEIESDRPALEAAHFRHARSSFALAKLRGFV